VRLAKWCKHIGLNRSATAALTRSRTSPSLPHGLVWACRCSRHQDFVACLYIEGQLPPVEPFQTNLTNLHAYTTIPFPLQPGTRLRLGWEDHRGGPGQGGLQVFAECGWEPEGAQRQLTRVGPRREDNGQARMSQEWVVGQSRLGQARRGLECWPSG